MLGFFSKANIAMILIFISIIGVMQWDRETLQEKVEQKEKAIGALNQTISQQRSILKANEKTINSYQAELEQRDRIDTENTLENQKIKNENKTLSARLRKIKNENIEAKKYLDSIIPNVVFNSMFDKPGAELPDKNRGVDKASSSKIHDKNTAAIYPGKHKRGHHTAKERLQKCVG